MKMVAHQVKTKDHPPDFKHIEVLVRCWYYERCPSYVTVFLEKKEGMTSSEIKASAIQKAREFLSKIQSFN